MKLKDMMKINHSSFDFVMSRRASMHRDLSVFVFQMGDPSAVLLMSCSAETMSSRLQCRRGSSSSFQSAPDREDVLHRRAESFSNDSQEVAAHYEHKKLLYTVKKKDEQHPDFWLCAPQNQTRLCILQLSIQYCFLITPLYEHETKPQI